MMIELTQAILQKLKDDGLDAREIGFKDLIDKTINLDRPAVNITINQATVKQVTLSTYKYILTVTLNIVFMDLKGGSAGEGRRKEGVYKLIEAISDSLILQKFGLELENGLYPLRFRNITTYDLAKAGFQVYALEFWCSYNVTYHDSEDADRGKLNTIVADYWLCPPDSTSMTPPSRAENYMTVGP